MLQVRAAFEWCVCLTGTLLHAGPAGMLAVQDIAVPGGGRFFSEWAFGEAFECIVKIDTKGRVTRHKVVMPPAHKQTEFVNYMTRLVTSLSLDSPEVASCLQLPERSHITLDTYEEPDWVTELRLRKTKQFKDNRVFWIPDAVDSKMEVPMIAAYIQAVSAELDIRDKQGLPTLADPLRVQAVMSREGRFDRADYLRDAARARRRTGCRGPSAHHRRAGAGDYAPVTKRCRPVRIRPRSSIFRPCLRNRARFSFHASTINVRA